MKAIKFHDFHFARFGSPVHDLSSFFYLEAIESKTYLDKLYEFLKIYYDSFSMTAKRFNKDPELLLPKTKIGEDWRKYSKSSMLLAMRWLKYKYIDTEDMEDNASAIDKEMESRTLVYNFHINNILEHMYHINAL